jgi:hypothetical protein
MPLKKILLLGLLIVICLVVVAFSNQVAQQLAINGGRLFGGNEFLGRFPGRFGIFGRHLPGWRGIVSAIGAFFFLYLSGVLALFLAPHQIGVMRAAMFKGTKASLRIFAIGVLSILAFFLLVGLGLLTAAAFPVPLLLLSGLVLITWLGLIVLALAVGDGLSHLIGLSPTNPLFDLAVGLLVVFTLGRIPIVGFVLTILVSALALGIAVSTRLGNGGAWSLNDLQSIPEVGTQDVVQQHTL